MTGFRQGRLVALERAGSKQGKAAWLCKCDCGSSAVVIGDSLRTGNTKSCGCYQREHWDRGTPPRRKHRHFGDDIGYAAAHWRVRKERGAARQHSCVDCGQQAVDWSLRNDAVSLRNGMHCQIEMTYSVDVMEYDPRCRPCHKTYDTIGVTA